MVVLKGVPRILSPQLLFAMSRMGHGDELVLADVNFPSSSVCRSGPEEIRADGHGIPELLEAILKFFPLDTYVKEPALLMQVTPSDVEKGMKSPVVWDKYKEIINTAEGHQISVGTIERFAFYERAKKSFAVVATGYRWTFAKSFSITKDAVKARENSEADLRHRMQLMKKKMFR